MRRHKSKGRCPLPLSLTQLHLSIKSLFYSRQVSTYTYFELNTNIISYPLLSIHLDQNQIQSSKLKLISMGGGGSKSLAPPGGSIHSRERRLSHVDTNPPPQSEKLVECPSCSRSFASDRIDKHVEVRIYYLHNSLATTLNFDNSAFGPWVSIE